MAQDRQLPLQVADILRDHLLLDVMEENAKMREGSTGRRLQVARDFLGRIDLSLGSSGRVASTSLNKSAIVKKGAGGLPFVCAYFDCEDNPLPLSDCLRGRVSMSGQEIGGNSWAGSSSILAVDDKGGSTRVKIIISAVMDVKREIHGLVVVDGEVRGLGDGDMVCLRDREEGGQERVQNHFSTRNSVTFTPQLISMLITPELRETIWTFGPRPTFESVQNAETLQRDPNDFIEYPPLPPFHKSRLAIVAALGCADSQMESFRENQQLKNEQFHLSKVEERLGLVEVFHTGGTLKLSLKEGLPSEDASGLCGWCIPLPEGEEYQPSSSVALNDLVSMECFVSGVRLQPVVAGFYENPHAGSRFFEKTFSNCRICGAFDQESIPGVGMDASLEMMQRTLQGEQVFPPTSKIQLTGVFFTLNSVQGVLDVLGIETLDSHS